MNNRPHDHRFCNLGLLAGRVEAAHSVGMLGAKGLREVAGETFFTDSRLSFKKLILGYAIVRRSPAK